MTQMTRGALRNVRTRLQSSIDTQIIENTSGLVTGTIMNSVLDSVSSVVEDIIDSADILTSGSLAPAFRTFLLVNQATSVDAGTTLSGTVTFEYLITEEDNVDGNLTLTQGVSTLSSAIDPKAQSVNIAINNITLAAGESVTFTLSGTALPGAGGAAFQATFTVTALQPDDYIYWGLDADGDPSNFVIGTAQQAPFARTQRIIVPNFADNQHLVIAQKSADVPITQILINGVDQFDAFTETASAFNVNAAAFDAYVSDNLLIGSIVSGDIITLVR